MKKKYVNYCCVVTTSTPSWTKYVVKLPTTRTCRNKTSLNQYIPCSYRCLKLFFFFSITSHRKITHILIWCICLWKKNTLRGIIFWPFNFRFTISDRVIKLHCKRWMERKLTVDEETEANQKQKQKKKSSNSRQHHLDHCRINSSGI